MVYDAIWSEDKRLIMKHNENKMSPADRAFVFVAIISIILTIIAAIMHEIYINL